MQLPRILYVTNTGTPAESYFRASDIEENLVNGVGESPTEVGCYVFFQSRSLKAIPLVVPTPQPARRKSRAKARPQKRRTA